MTDCCARGGQLGSGCGAAATIDTFFFCTKDREWFQYFRGQKYTLRVPGIALLSTSYTPGI